jgi:dihydroorotate dehydrogenase electron transfer subunit
MDENLNQLKINKNVKQIKAEIISNKKVGPYHHMVFAVGDIAQSVRPGNFVAISVGGENSASILRRAFAIYRATDKG